MENNKKFGVDLSTWQTGVNYEKAVKEGGVEFAVLRASFGWSEGQKDNQFENHYKGFQAQNIPIGAYHYSYATTVAEAKKEAAFFLSCIRGKAFELPCYLDVEDKCQQSLNRSTLTEIIKTWCKAVEAAGYKAGVYTGVYWIRDHMTASELFPKYELWIASWGSKKPVEYDCQMWQFGGSINLVRRRTVPGIIGTVDQNYLYKDYAGSGIPKKGSVKVPEKTADNCKVTGSGVNLREEAHTVAKILETLPKGTRLTWLCDDGWGWSKVRCGSLTGWISNRYLSRKGVSGYKTGICNGYAVNVRRSPSLKGAVIRQMNKGDSFTVIAILPNRWLHVELDGEEAYVYNDRCYLTIKK